jgi:hypothetical protein
MILLSQGPQIGGRPRGRAFRIACGVPDRQNRTRQQGNGALVGIRPGKSGFFYCDDAIDRSCGFFDIAVQKERGTFVRISIAT